MHPSGKSVNKIRPWQRTVQAAFVMALAGVWVANPALAQETSPKEVSIYVTVEQGDKLVQGLGQQNFRLLENGQSKTFRLEAPEKPVTIALLVEYSRSSGLYFSDIQAALSGFMKAAPEGDWIAAATFSRDLDIRVDFTKERGEVEDAFAGLGTPVSSEIDTYDAVYQMLDRMGSLKGRRVLILVGSGLNTFGKHTLDEVRNALRANNVTVYCVGAGSLLRGKYQHQLGNAGRMELIRAETFMRMLSDESGGEAWFPKFESAFAPVMQGIMQSIDSQYRLVYTPQVPANQKFHKITVEAFRVVNDKRENFKVRARAGWRF